MKSKKTPLTTSYEEAYIQHLKQHQEKIQRTGFKIISEKQLDRNDRNQQFYKVYQRQFRNSLMMKHGYKIVSLRAEQEDLALYCFSLFQAEASFPIKIFTVDHTHKKVSQMQSRKDLWMETQILVSSLSPDFSEHRFETKIYKFFNDYLLKNLRDFMKKSINWDFMISKSYSDEQVIAEFQHDIIQTANQKFSQLFD